MDDNILAVTIYFAIGFSRIMFRYMARFIQSRIFYVLCVYVFCIVYYFFCSICNYSPTDMGETMTKLIIVYLLLIALVIGGIIYNAHLIRVRHRIANEIKHQKIVAVATSQCGVLADGSYGYCVEIKREMLK